MSLQHHCGIINITHSNQRCKCVLLSLNCGSDFTCFQSEIKLLKNLIKNRHLSKMSTPRNVSRLILYIY